MKYNTTIGSMNGEPKKSTLTIYADMDVGPKAEAKHLEELKLVKEELQRTHTSLKEQTRRCRQLVEKYTKKLRQKDYQFQCEKTLRDDQLAKVLRALLIFEARLKQEQKLISHQLKEKDLIIKKQRSDIKKLLTNQYCKNCNSYYSSQSPNLESLDSSSDYTNIYFQDSNLESLDSSTETYATISEKDYTLKEAKSDETVNTIKSEENGSSIYIKNKNKDSLGRSNKHIKHRKSVGSYFEVLKMRSDSSSPFSQEDNTSNDFESLPPESMSEKSVTSEKVDKTTDLDDEDVEESLNYTDVNTNYSFSESNNTVIQKLPEDKQTGKKIMESIPVFDSDATETHNENWYASASDQEDEEQRDLYRNNPVLECVNQILIQNMNDSLVSPPKTPNTERKNKNKRVKFSDEAPSVDGQHNELTKNNLHLKNEAKHPDGYYETPIQKTPNYYEEPQSIYSNDYEQILSKCSETYSDQSPAKIDNKRENEVNKMGTKKLSLVSIDNVSEVSTKDHYYIDMDKSDDSTCTVNETHNIIRKAKILRKPPALPPKPANLVSKYKITNTSPPKNATASEKSDEIEPDYCSISELNLPTNSQNSPKNVFFKKISVVAEINAPTSQDVLSKLEKSLPSVDPIKIETEYDPIESPKKSEVPSPKSPKNNVKPSPKKPEIPKLPQVSEIIIPEDDESVISDESTSSKSEERIAHDNYVKNNTQILQTKPQPALRRNLMQNSSVSSLISGFNGKPNELESSKKNLYKKMFSSFENLQNLEKQSVQKIQDDSSVANFDSTFDLSQNFEEFKLDDCEIEEYTVDIPDILSDDSKSNHSSEHIDPTLDDTIPNLSRNSIELLKKHLEERKNSSQSPTPYHMPNQSKFNLGPEPTYEHFLECTGLSTKSILTPSRLPSNNHKNVLKPKDVKLRSSVKGTGFTGGVFKKQNGGTIKYWSEPYV